MPGPMPKRSTERRRRNKVPGETTVTKAGRVVVPVCPREAHPVARRWYRSLKTSGQSEFFEPSDWAAALYVVEVMSKNLQASRFSAQLFAGVWAAMTDLMTTESARRRARVEVERVLEEKAEDRPTALDEYRKALGQ
jgi:hypothetical protein